jgi:hypothetical protein
MRRIVCAVIAFALAAVPVYALDPGKAEGALLIDGKRYELSYAYAIAKHKNQLSGKNDNTLLILTDQPLPADAKLHDMEATLPDNINGVMLCVDKERRVTHVAVQHPAGMFDGGFFEGVENYEFHQRKGDGAFAGTASSKRITTNTMTFSYDATFNAAMK